MKILTVNFLTCAVKSCKSSLSSSSSSTAHQTDELSPFPLHFRDAVLERTEIQFNRRFIQNILPRVNWEALTTTAAELGLTSLMPAGNPVDDPSWHMRIDSSREKESGPEEGKMEAETGTGDEEAEAEAIKKDDMVLRQLHTLLLETAVSEGKLICGKCGFEYPIKEGVGNFLLPAHLG